MTARMLQMWVVVMCERPEGPIDGADIDGGCCNLYPSDSNSNYLDGVPHPIKGSLRPRSHLLTSLREAYLGRAYTTTSVPQQSSSDLMRVCSVL